MFKDVMEHLKTNHEYIHQNLGGPNQFDSAIDGMRTIEITEYWDSALYPTEIVFHGQHKFFLQRCRKDFWNWFWFQIYGSPAEAEKYEYTIYLSKNGREHGFTGKPHPLDTSYLDVYNDQTALRIRQKALKEVSSCVGMFTEKFSLNYKIRCLKDEAKDEDMESGVSVSDTD